MRTGRGLLLSPLLSTLLAACAACASSDRPAPSSALPCPDASLPSPTEPCTATEPACDAETPYRCAADSTREYLAPCSAPAPFCVAGGCVACPPGELRCSPEHPAVPERCAPDGSGWTPLPACDAALGERCTAGHCAAPCAAPDGARGYLGCDYWATQTPNSQLDPAFEFAVALANPQSYAVTVRLSGGALAAPLSIELAPAEARAVALPWVRALVQHSPQNRGCTGLCSVWPGARSATVVNGAYHVESDAPVAAYQFNPLHFVRAGGYLSFSNDASLLLSRASLTNRYIVLTAPNWATTRNNIILGGFIAVTAVSGESTSVAVELPSTAGVPGQSGTVRRDNLTPGDVFLLVGGVAGDLSGAVVTANAPVAVFAGHDCTPVPQGRFACDHIEEQVAPIETLGRDFVVSPLADRPGLAARVRVVSPYAVDLRFDPPSVHRAVRLAAREVFEFDPTAAFRLTATRPVLVAQYMFGQGDTSEGSGDPAMVYEVPSQQYRDRYDLLVPDSYTSNFLSVVVPHGAHGLLDDVALTGDRTPIGPWDVLSTAVPPGAHRLRTSEGVPLGVKVYGVARYTSYMYPGGLDLRLLPPG
jgi:hypothetical protein